MSGLCTVKIKWNLTGYRYQLWHHCSRVLSHSLDCDKMNLNIIVVSANVMIHINASIQCVCASVYGNWINAIEISFLYTRECWMPMDECVRAKRRTTINQCMKDLHNENVHISAACAVCFAHCLLACLPTSRLAYLFVFRCQLNTRKIYRYMVK